MGLIVDQDIRYFSLQFATPFFLTTSRCHEIIKTEPTMVEATLLYGVMWKLPLFSRRFCLAMYSMIICDTTWWSIKASLPHIWRPQSCPESSSYSETKLWDVFRLRDMCLNTRRWRGTCIRRSIWWFKTKPFMICNHFISHISLIRSTDRSAGRPADSVNIFPTAFIQRKSC